ncbi:MULTISPECIES: sugar ABC transporter substrate-binding protein [Cryobacterium]|uniref:Sugar ABC transporter substrate-binding protein n=1 Tax=Cryobacterium zongtaii TaxID=1259217 RepID=A0A2S3ZD57_9MICO|nr:sugar ABC transporter substrate-binding protein [Cryobacterium zongtaii]POH67908.1 sugar ABC transporter substrate-binding protein [Cryobacterium zongtaii]TFC47913.1 sugar ABC transporter substrate-binding protein [Cryobacterium sp. TMN-39-2]
MPLVSRISARRTLLGASAGFALLALTACTGQPVAGAGSGAGAAPADDSGRTYALVVHSVPGDAFWDVVKTGAEAAGNRYGATVTYQGDPDVQKQSQLIETAIAAKVDGIIVSMANPEGLRGAVTAAVAADIPVITINSGAEESAALGAMTHIGQGEYLAGQGAGRQLAEASAKKVICVIHEAGNAGLEDRCRGAADTLAGSLTNVQVDIANVAEAQSTITSALLADPGIDGVLTLNSAVGVAAAQAVAEAGSDAQIGTFDVSADVTSLITDGSILFAVDQQPYLQGYLPVDFFELFYTNGNVVGGSQPVYSGPGFVTKENAEQVATFAGNGTR